MTWFLFADPWRCSEIFQDYLPFSRMFAISRTTAPEVIWVTGSSVTCCTEYRLRVHCAEWRITVCWTICKCGTADIGRDFLMLFLCRYEFQEDHSLLDEYQFTYDAKWFKDQIQGVLSFWQGSREPRFVTEEERWKCDNSICKFAPICPMIASTSKRWQ